jgi:YD repeat-containing protein
MTLQIGEARRIRKNALVCISDGSDRSAIYAYDGDSRPTVTTLENGKTFTNTYDSLGRLTRKRIGLGSNYDVLLSYLPGANGSQSALLGSYKNGSDGAITYTYDNVGNIKTITQNGSTITYHYDALNQLIREDRPAESVTYG